MSNNQVQILVEALCPLFLVQQAGSRGAGTSLRLGQGTVGVSSDYLADLVGDGSRLGFLVFAQRSGRRVENALVGNALAGHSVDKHDSWRYHGSVRSLDRLTVDALDVGVCMIDNSVHFPLAIVECSGVVDYC